MRHRYKSVNEGSQRRLPFATYTTQETIHA